MTDPHGFPILEISFAPAWWHAHYGMDFSAPRWQDPITATELDRDQRRLLFERFGDLGQGEADPAPRPCVGSEYGHRFMSAFWGCEILYLPDQYPAAIPLPGAAERIAELEVPEVAASPVVHQAFRNARLLEERYGHFTAAINYGGPLNNGVSVLGAEMLGVCAADPELARRTLRKMGEAVIAVHDRVACPLNKIPVSQAHAGDWGIGNCPVFMLSPRTYREVVLPIDLWFREQFAGGFDLHHCGHFHPYTQVYRALRPSSLDVGPGSDLRATRAAYPDLPIATYIDVAALAGMSRDGIDAMLTRMIEDAWPPKLFSYIRVAEAGPEVSDTTVRDLLTAPQRIQPHLQREREE